MKNSQSKEENSNITRACREKFDQIVQEMQEELRNEARLAASRDGVNNVPQHDAERAILSPFEQQISNRCQRITNTIAHRVENLLDINNSNFLSSIIVPIADKKSNTYREVRLISRDQRDLQKMRIEQKQSFLNEQIEQLQQQIKNHKAEMQVQIARMGGEMPTSQGNSPFLYYTGATVLALGEMPINYSAMIEISDSLSPIACIGIAFFLSLVAGASAHFTGIAYYEQKAKTQAYALAVSQGESKEQPVKSKKDLWFVFLPAVLIIVTVFWLRSSTGDMGLSFLNAALVLLALTWSFQHVKSTSKEAKLYFQHKKEMEKLQKKLTNMKQEYLQLDHDILEVEKKYETIDVKEALDHQLFGKIAEEMIEEITATLHSYSENVKHTMKFFEDELKFLYRKLNTDARLQNGIPQVPYWNQSM